MMNLLISGVEDVRRSVRDAPARASVMRCLVKRLIDGFTVFPRNQEINEPQLN
jgi:hypothetical protein